MKLVAFGPHDWRLLDHQPENIFDIPPGHVLLRPTAVGICGSDFKMYVGSEFYWGPNGRCKNGGVTVGHEFVGEILAIAPDLLLKTNLVDFTQDADAHDYSKFSINQLVCVEQAIQCCSDSTTSASSCWHCQNGGKNKCDKLTILGQGADGGAASFTLLKHPHLHPIPQGMKSQDAVLAEPLAVSIHAVDRVASVVPLGTSSHNVICISGGGMVGLGIVSALKHLYPSCQVIILEPMEYKRKKALELGAHAANHPDEPFSNLSSLKNLIDEKGGVDVYFEASGNPTSLQRGFNLVRKRGVICHVGIFKNGNVSLDFNLVSAGKELTIVGSSLGRGAWQRALQIINQGGLDGIVTHTLPLKEWERGLSMVDPDNVVGREAEQCIKVVLLP
jgi:threonine dehydrogenase-like Zn-dependent dehydrogenase